MNYGVTGARKLLRRLENPYVTDGLVAMWDLKWNAGLFQSHDVLSRGWVDCVGGFRFDCSGMSLAPDGGLVLPGGTYVDAAPSFDPALAAGGMYVEMVAHGKSPHVNSTADCGAYFGSVELGILIDRETTASRSGRVISKTAGGQAGNYAYTVDVSHFQSYHTWGARRSAAPSQSPRIAAFMDGGALNTSQTSFYDGTNAGLSVIRLAAAVSKPLYIKAVRCYSRALSDAEVMANHQADRKRFGM